MHLIAEADTCIMSYSEGRIDKFGRENTIITDEAKCIAVEIIQSMVTATQEKSCSAYWTEKKFWFLPFEAYCYLKDQAILKAKYVLSLQYVQSDSYLV